jgi:hypothetical protein
MNSNNSTDEEEDGDNSSSSGNEKPATRSGRRAPVRGGRQSTVANNSNNNNNKATAHKKGATRAKAFASATAAPISVPRKYATRRGKGDGQELFEGIDKITKIKKKARVPAPKVSPDETVIKVKMLTGTLYLYRGLRPRAEFVRVV